MGRAPCCDKMGVKRGPWSPEEDLKLVSYILKYGHGNWRALPKFAGLLRCGKSCRLRWTNYLRPDIKRGHFSPEEEQQIIQLHAILGNRWSAIASHLPGRTDNEIKNVWNTHLKKRLAHAGIDPLTHALPANAVNAQQRSPSASSTNTAQPRHPLEIVTPFGLANPKAEANAHELKGGSTLCIDSREMDDLLEQALDFPSVEAKSDQSMLFDGSIPEACSISYSPNSALNESSISTVETDEINRLVLDSHDPHSKLFDYNNNNNYYNYNPAEDESFGVDGMLLLGGEDPEKAFRRYNSTSYAELQYNDSALEDTTASAFCSQVPFWPSQNAGALDDGRPSPSNASSAHQRVGQIMAEDGSTSPSHLSPNTSSNSCAADVLLQLPDDSSNLDTVDFADMFQDNFWIAVLKRVGLANSPSSSAIN